MTAMTAAHRTRQDGSRLAFFLLSGTARTDFRRGAFFHAPVIVPFMSSRAERRTSLVRFFARAIRIEPVLSEVEGRGSE